MPFNDITFSFLISYTLNGFIDVSKIPFSLEELPKNVPKNGDVLSGLLAPDCTRSFSSVYKGFKFFHILARYKQISVIGK